MKKIIRLVFVDILRNRFILVYTLLLSLVAWSVFNLEDSAAKGMLTILNVVLLITPLVSILFSTVYVFNCSEFVELLLSQPVRRSQIWISIFFGLSLSQVLAFVVAVGVPMLIHAPAAQAWLLLVTGAIITVVFVALALLSSIITRDKAKGIGIAIMLWLYFAILFDSLMLFLVFQFADYPIERLMAGVAATSPIDLARIMNLIQMESSAMLGYTGAVFQQLFGGAKGTLIAVGILMLWATLPFLLSLRIFNRKDL